MLCPRLSNAKWVIAVVALTAIIVASVSLFCLLVGIWPLDILSAPSWFHVAGVALPNGEELHLFQKWGDDFYVTAIACKGRNGFGDVFIIDADDRRLWRWNVKLDTNKKCATIDKIGGRVFVYDLSQRTLETEGLVWKPFQANELKDTFGALLPYGINGE